jgi:hypothetical protein
MPSVYPMIYFGVDVFDSKELPRARLQTVTDKVPWHVLQCAVRRRSWYGFICSMVLTLLSLSIACTSETATESAPLIGAWRSTIEFETGAFAEITDLEFMYVFNAGGTLTESSNYDGAPPVPPAYGVWRMIGPNEFEARFEFFSTAPSEGDAFLKGAGWPPSGRGVFTERIELSRDAQTFTSTIRYEVFGLRDDPLEGGGTASGEGVRIGF